MACSHLYVFVHLYAHLANLGNVIKLVQAAICTLGTSTTSKVVNAWPATKAPLMANTANTGGSFCLWADFILFDLGWFPLLSHVGHIPLSHLLREFADIVLSGMQGENKTDSLHQRQCIIPSPSNMFLISQDVWTGHLRAFPVPGRR